MAEFLLGRIKFVWKGPWATSSSYVKDDVINYGGKTYICTNPHTSNGSDFYLDTANWNIFADGQTWKDEWAINTYYKVGDIVKYGGYLYIANNGHTSADTITKGLEFNQSDWDLYAEFFNYRNDWAVSTRYRINDVVKYGGTEYVCIDDHTSNATSQTDTDGLESDNNGRALTFDSISAADVTRTQGTYTSISPTGGNGSGLVVTIDVDNIGGVAITITNNGSGYSVGDTVTIPDSLLGSGGAPDVTFNIASVADRWNIFAEGFDWKSDWTATTRYKRNDLVKYGGQLYLCIVGHRSGTLSEGLEDDQSKWQYFHKGTEYRNDWSAGTRYRINDLVKSGSSVWICTTYHTSTNSFRADQSNWAQFVPGLEFEDSWAIGTEYQKGDIVTYGGHSYIAITNNVGKAPYSETADWKLYLKGFNFRGEWAEDSSTQDYYAGDVVRLGGYTYLCIKDTVGTEQKPPLAAYWTKLNEGFNWTGDWTNITQYNLGDIVYYGVNSYVCVTAHQSDQAIAQNRPDQDTDGSEWNILAGGNEQSAVTTDGDILYYSGSGPTRLPIGNNGQVLTVSNSGLPAWQYWGRQDHVYYVGPNGVDGVYPQYGANLDRPFKSIRRASRAIEEGSLIPNAVDNLRKNRQFIQRETVEWVDYQIANNIAPFTSGFSYNKDKCYRDTGHIIDALIYDMSHGGNKFARNVAFTYFTKAGLSYVAGQETETVAAINYTKSLVDVVLTKIDPATNYQSENSFTPAVVQIKTSETEEDNAQALADSLIAIVTDAITAGDTDDVPAEEQVQKTIFVATGEFKEILPIVVPANTAVVGDELRSTRIVPGTASDYTQASDVDYSLAGIAHMKSLLSDIITGQSITKEAANTQTQSTAGPVGTATETGVAEGIIDHLSDYITYFTADTQDSTVPTLTNGQTQVNISDVDITTDPLLVRITTATAHGLRDRQEIHITGVGGCVELNKRIYYADVISTTEIDLYENYGLTTKVAGSDYTGYTSGGVVAFGGNDISADQDIHNAVRQLYINKEFIAEDVTSYITRTYPSYTYSVSSCKRDVREYVEGLIYDLMYGGTYRTHYNAKWYVNAVLGSTTEDMFYLRNGTGLRNCSLSGLSGVLGTANAYGTKRPTAGAFTSLDPGWGPADSNAWITNKSPYVQNVSNFGTAAIGLKVDGDLHDAGNDSIVANDYTQIISDGIGCWVTNLGRSELVSVFSYYGHIGYLAENGGKIRATNGNSSYGTFGCVAEGVDVTEVPITGKVDNRFQQAIIDTVLTDQDKVMAVFFKNAGINYEGTTTFTITGDGASVSTLGNERRDQAVHEVRMLNTDVNADDEGDFGGADYGFAENTAQFGDTSSIRISNTDTANTGDYNGMRIFITSGLGVGQYGYIGTYSAANKDATVYKESDDQPGWDHIIPGTTIAELMDGTTKYIIEPRVEIAEPPFASTAQSYGGSIQSNRNSLAYGNDRFIMLGKSTNQTRFAQNPTSWSSGGNLPGSGDWTALAYGAGDDSTYTWVCADKGTVNGAYSTDDGATWSSMTLPSAVDWTSTVYAKDKYVMVASGGTQAAYSEDGVTWLSATLPSTQNWKKVIFGFNEFIAIGDTATYAQSTDGINWNSKAFPTFTDTDTNVKDIAWGNGRYLMIGDKGTQGYISFDGNTWKETTIDTTADSSIGGGDAFLEYGQGAFLWFASTTGQIKDVDTIGAADALRPTATYQIGTGDYTVSGTGNGATFQIDIDGSGAATVTVRKLGKQFIDGETITVSDSLLGNGGAPDLTFDVNGIIDSSQSSVSNDGVIWRGKTNGKTDGVYSTLAFGNPDFRPTWFALQSGSGTGALTFAGAKALVRSVVATGKIARMIVHEPGSGYSSIPTLTITDPNNTVEAPVQVRVGDGALGNPIILNGGTGYETASGTISGTGTIDQFQPGNNIFVKGLTAEPKAGTNVEFSNLPGKYYKLVTIRELTGSAPNIKAKLQISPDIPVDTAPPHEDPVTLRLRYSQVRLTGHDFLDIGTGNLPTTNYPDLPSQDADPAKETVVGGGGRVFFTSTDQDGNFRVGDLFSVEQSTGVATLDADAFNIAGLNELSLGSVELGGTGAVITEFSTDGTFAANSDSVVPTQRAIRTFINAQIGGGNSELNVNILTAGVIEIQENIISTTTGVDIKVNAKMNFTGGIDGDAVALQRMLLS